MPGSSVGSEQNVISNAENEARVQFGIWRAYFSGAGNRMLVATVIQLAFSPVMLRP